MQAQSTGNKNKAPLAVQVLGYVVGTAWFALLALSGSERPTWLRFVYGMTAAVFLAGAAVTTAIRLRKRSAPVSEAADGPS